MSKPINPDELIPAKTRVYYLRGTEPQADVVTMSDPDFGPDEYLWELVVPYGPSTRTEGR